MAQKYRKVDPRVWDDEKFAELSPECKLVALNLFTAQANRCGLFRFSVGLSIEQTGLPPDSYGIAMKTVCDTFGWKFDKSRKVLYLPTWWKYNAPENSKHMQGCLSDLHDLPQTPLLKEFAENTRHIPDHSIEVFKKAMGIAIPYPTPYQEQEQELSPPAREAEISDPIPEPEPGPEPDPIPEPDGATVGGFSAPVARKPSHSRAHGPLVAPEVARLAALAAVSAWAAAKSPIGRGWEINEAEDEHTVVFNLVEELAVPSLSPVIRGSEAVPRYLLIPKAVEVLRGKSKPFKTVKFACACVRDELSDWANEGVSPARSPPRQSQPRVQDYKPVKGFKG